MFRFTIIDYTTNPLGDSTVIPEPLGFENLELVIKRDPKLDGIFFYPESFNNLEFYGLSGQILQDAYTVNGIAANCELIIEFQCSDSDDFVEIAHLKFDFSEIEKICDDFCKLSVGMLDISCSTILMNRWETKVNLESLQSLDSSTNNLTPYANLATTLHTNTGMVELVTQTDLNIEPNPLVPNTLFQFFGNEFDSQWTANAGPDYEGNMTISLDYNFVTNDIREKFVLYQNLLINPYYYAIAGGLFIDFLPFPNYTSWAYYQEKNAEKIECGSELVMEMEFDIDFYFDSECSNQQDVTFYVQMNVVHSRGPFIISKTPIFTSALQQVAPCVQQYINISVPFTTLSFTDVQEGDYINIVVQMNNFVGYIYKIIRSDLYRVILKYQSGFVRTRKQRICEGSEYKGYMINETFSRVAESITNDCLRVYSDYFGRIDAQPYISEQDGCMGYLSLSDGLNVRRAVLSDNNLSQLSISMKDLYDGFNPIANIGIGIENDNARPGYELLRIEQRDYFYQNFEVADLSGARDVKLKSMPNKYLQTINFGYTNFETERTNGLDDIHAQREYRSEHDNVNNKVSIVSPFMASHYAFELTRREIGKNVIDWRYDNYVFPMVNRRKEESDPAGSYNFISELLGGLYAIANNIRGSQFYRNVRISPMRNILRHLKELMTTYIPLANKFIFTSGTGNFKAKIQYNNAAGDCILEKKDDNTFDGLHENQDISLSLLSDINNGIPYKTNIKINFDIPMSFNTYLNIKANPYGYIKCNCNDSIQYGWIDEIKFNPSTGMASVTLTQVNQ